MLQRDKREIRKSSQELVPRSRVSTTLLPPVHINLGCARTREYRPLQRGRERGWERSRRHPLALVPPWYGVRQFVAQFPKSDDITVTRTARGGGEARRGGHTTNLQNHLHVVAVALGLLRALEARAVVQQGLGDTRLFRVRGRRRHHVDLHRHSRAALPRCCVQRDVQSLSTTTMTTAAAAAVVLATVTTATAGVTTRDAAPRISRWGDRVAMTAGNPRGYGRFYAPSLEPRPPSGPRARFALARGDDGTISRSPGAPGPPKGRDVVPFSLSCRAGEGHERDSSERSEVPPLEATSAGNFTPETPHGNMAAVRIRTNIVIFLFLSLNKLARCNCWWFDD